ncbi:hypothetical protein D6861_004425 [Macrococcoides caseolyticum]|uniref:Uncharacterized protein n=1 Tax=Macrococcoides canis TaxID=1855823 RepID=A0A6G5ZZB3_9STAP|nr:MULTISPECIES: hypothetical protein [Macrococcus]MBQ5152543.1 hypothetical protein [Macrococcus caseolyticus]QHW12296.1 hypothetical protein 0076A_00009 [Macrococcus canis]QIH77383.1 hypothetical protein GTN30_01695 [Macrococcus canis]RAI80819.1 hypothetical protein BFS34_004895 [Macrococcus caseolyticus subsp. hominis]RKO15513.1 hypothetical protein D6861_04510 [Macrococcus caseolyticus]
MTRKTIRISDPLIEYLIKEISDDKKISENKLINIILEKALIHQRFDTKEQEVEDLLRNVATSNNKLIEAIERQTEAINGYTKEIKKLLEV